MILIIKLNKEKLHDYEFVKPIEDLVKKQKLKFIVKRYDEITKVDLEKAKRVIICGTSLKDFEYLNNLDMFEWIKSFDKPILGICAGMQVIVKIFNGKLKRSKSIGQEKIKVNNEFLSVNGEKNVYSLHNFGISKLPVNFKSFSKDQEIISNGKIYATLFHPEVRNKELIINFLANL